MMLFSTSLEAAELVRRDVCVYGGSPAAYTAALQIRAQGRSVALIVPGQHVGGMLVEGLGSQDIDNHSFDNSVALGGMALEFYERMGAAYGTSHVYKFESSVAETVILNWLNEYGVEIFLGNRLLESHDAVIKQDNTIREIVMENGNRFRADVFIDGTVEGDLMKWTGVSYTWGRESNATYGETLNGIRENNTHRNFTVAVDPYIIPGDPSSGVIPTIQDEPLGTPGEGDERIMGFCFRSCLTQNASNKIPFTQPADYDASHYEIYRRFLAAGGSLYEPRANLPNGKTDLGSWHDLSGNLYGMNHSYPDGDYATREQIYQEHLSFIQGLYWFLANDPDIPASVRNTWSQWGLAADEFTDNGGWPRRLYVRSARRMISDYVITEGDVMGDKVADDPIGVAYWPPDMHHSRRIIKDGKAYNEGFVFGGGTAWQPFGISYRAIVPKADECSNLIVPAALSSSYVGYGSIRLEWTFMTLGQSAGAAAVEALRGNTAVQDIDYAQLRWQLLADGQVLTLATTEEEPDGTLIVDNGDPAQFASTGNWVSSTFFPGYIGSDYLHDGNMNKGSLTATFQPQITVTDTYAIYARWNSDDKRATNVPVTINHAHGQTQLTVNQQINGNTWVQLGTFDLEAGNDNTITISNTGTDGFVIVDAIRLVPLSSANSASVAVVPAVSTVREGSSTLGEFSIVREGQLSTELEVNFNLSGSASSGIDFDALPNSILIPAGKASTHLSILTLADNEVEGTEDVTLTLSPGIGYTVSSEHEATIRIDDRAEHEWQNRFFTSTERSEGILNAWDADPDKDGMSNLSELVFGTHPRKAENSASAYAVSVNNTSGAPLLIVNYPYSEEASNVSIETLSSPDLENWVPITPESVQIDWDEETEVPIFQNEININEGQKVFIRLEMSL